jgi:alkyldihydroxyacetonephosphate synthase
MMTFTGWGYPGSAFDVSDKPALWDYIRAKMGVSRDRPTPPVDPKTIVIPRSRLEPAVATALREALGAENFATDDEARLLHSFGKSYRDLLRARRGEIGRLPDAVAFPGSHAQVEQVIAVARTHRLKVVPFGGGTNIVGGVEPSPAWAGGVLTVSLRRMNRLLALDEVSQVATLEAGALGPELEAALNARGWTLGHFPDSFEYSTLGGWLATRSAGMQSDARGKIEDMVVALKLAAPAGTIETRPVPRGATGPDLNQLVVGSEGVFGIITEATMRVYPLKARAYRGLLLPDFRTGMELMRRCWREGVPPATMRLSNPEETQLSFTLKPVRGAWSRWFAAAAKAYLRVGRRFDFNQVCLMIVGWEGTPEEIARQRERVLTLARECNAFDAGAGAGDAWFARKYEYPLLRDLVMDIGGMADVTEASVLWKDALPTYEKVHAALRAAVARDGVPGYVGCHLSHVYAEGVCLYFTFATARESGNELPQYLRLKQLAVDTLVASGASLSHHHSIGYEHLPWMRDYAGAPALAALRGVKTALDPENLCNPGKLLPADDSALEHYWPGWRSGAATKTP